MGNSRVRYEVIRQTLATATNSMNVSTLCKIAGVSRSGYYSWLNNEEKRKKQELLDQEDFELILKAYRHRGYQKGARSIYMHLIHQQPPVIMNIKKIRRLMKKYGLFCTIRRANPYRRMMKAMRTNAVADNLVNREFTTLGPRKVLLTDITYIPLNQKFCYLSTIIDAYTRQILSYVLSPSLEIDFVLETINRLIEQYGVSLDTETMIHSDQGAHYTSVKFSSLVSDHGLRQSMSRRGNCWDNAPQESFYGHMKDEIDVSWCTTFEEIKAVIDDWIDYYNKERYQWQLAKLSPDEYYEFVTTGAYPLDAAPLCSPPD